MIPATNKWMTGAKSKLALMLAFLILAFTTPVTSQTPPPFSAVRVEQEWEVKINSGNKDIFAPQINLWLKPDPDVDSGFLVLINYRDQPEFLGGGLQVQGWDEDISLKHVAVEAPALSKTETIKLTLFMEVADGKLNYGVASGTSPTYGDLSKAGLTASVPTSLKNFSKYNTVDSVDNTLIQFGKPHVDSIKIKKVRLTDAKGNVTELPGSDVFP